MEGSSQYSEYRDGHILICDRINFDVVSGDITTSTEDTVINSTDDDVNLGVSVAKALANKAGPAYRQACKHLVPLAEGMVKETGAYDMPCKQILHCNCLYWSKQSQELKDIFIKCLEKSAQKGHQSVATPTIGMGAKGYPADVVAFALPEAIAEYAEKNPESSIKQVKLYLYQDEITIAEIEVFKLTLLLLGGKRTTNGQKLTNGAIFEVFIGDLAETKADVMVNSTTSSVSLSCGAVSAALLKKGGQSLQDECNTLSPIRDGDVAVTRGHGLPCNNVVHACTPIWNGAKTEKELKKLIIKCLQAAEDLNTKSVAFSALGTGVLQCPSEIVAKIFLLACAEFSSNNFHAALKTIKVVIFPNDLPTRTGFEKVLRRKLSPYIPTREVPEQLPVGIGKLLEGLPTHWQNQQSTAYREFQVSEGTKEWKDCIRKFQETLIDVSEWTFLEVRRIQNAASYQLYSAMRIGVAAKLGLKEEEVERTLWHGTKQESVLYITRNKFDRGFAGTATGTSYGAGAYFSTTTEYSASVCQENNAEEKFVIMVKVITGEYTKGRPDMKTAPYKEGSKLEQYDSVVDDVTDPTMFVVFHDASAYPEYVVKFKRTNSRTRDSSVCVPVPPQYPTSSPKPSPKPPPRHTQQNTVKVAPQSNGGSPKPPPRRAPVAESPYPPPHHVPAAESPKPVPHRAPVAESPKPAPRRTFPPNIAYTWPSSDTAQSRVAVVLPQPRNDSPEPPRMPSPPPHHSKFACLWEHCPCSIV